jgi:hypothetical protein
MRIKHILLLFRNYIEKRNGDKYTVVYNQLDEELEIVK